MANETIKVGDKVSYNLKGVRRTGYVRELHTNTDHVTAVVARAATGTFDRCVAVGVRALTLVTHTIDSTI